MKQKASVIVSSQKASLKNSCEGQCHLARRWNADGVTRTRGLIRGGTCWCMYIMFYIFIFVFIFIFMIHIAWFICYISCSYLHSFIMYIYACIDCWRPSRSLTLKVASHLVSHAPFRVNTDHVKPSSEWGCIRAIDYEPPKSWNVSVQRSWKPLAAR